MSDRRARLSTARLYLVCGSRPGGRELADVIAAAVAGGVDVVQLREKESSEEELVEVAAGAAEICRELGALLIVNDSPRLAVRAGADGVHVGQDDMPLPRVREIVGPELIVGLSTHAPEEVDAAGAGAGAGAGGVDYIGVGPVHETPTKPGRPAVGTSLVAYAAEHASVPFFAIGGLHAGNVAEVLDAGAERVCVLRAIGDAPDPRAAARELRRALR